MESPQPRLVVEARDVTTRFGATLVHDRVSLSVREREILAIVGGSGSGKSTLLREILALQRPTSGSIRLFGEPLEGIGTGRLDVLRRRTGVLFQRDALFSSMSVLQNVGMPLREHTALEQSAIDGIAAVKIGMVGLPRDSAAKSPSQLSGGMRKRAGLARALALDPELLFLDEPTSGLDPVGAAGLDELILRLRDSLALTVVMVTHDVDSLWRVADRVVMLGDAQVVGEGALQTLYASQHPTVRAFFHGARGRAAEAEAWNRG